MTIKVLVQHCCSEIVTEKLIKLQHHFCHKFLVACKSDYLHIAMCPNNKVAPSAVSAEQDALYLIIILVRAVKVQYTILIFS